MLQEHHSQTRSIDEVLKGALPAKNNTNLQTKSAKHELECERHAARSNDLILI